MVRLSRRKYVSNAVNVGGVLKMMGFAKTFQLIQEYIYKKEAVAFIVLRLQLCWLYILFVTKI